MRCSDQSRQTSFVSLTGDPDRLLAGIELVSFDVFDTAVIRPLLKPTDLFRLIEPAVHRLLGNSGTDFVVERRAAERQARQESLAAGGTAEVTFERIYKTLAGRLDITRDCAQEIAALELAAEREVCRVNPVIRHFYRHCLERGCRVVFLSDMYLPTEAIAEILAQCGYDGHETVLVSAALGVSKGDGGLYRQALRRLGVAPDRWLHIGDNQRADVVQARAHGLRVAPYQPASCAVPSTHERRAARPWRNGAAAAAGDTVAFGLVSNRLQHPAAAVATDNRVAAWWEEFGYTVAGPLLAGFSEWVADQAEARRLDRLYFLARDGRLMQQAYELLMRNDPRVRPTRYLLISRRAANFAALTTLDGAALKFLTGTRRIRLEAAQFFERLGIDWRPHTEVFQACGFRDPHQLVASGRDRARLQRVFRSVADLILREAAQEREILVDYLAAAGLGPGTRVGLVDIGWNCTTQRSLAKILDVREQEIDMVGLYLGTYPRAAGLAALGTTHAGYLFECGRSRRAVRRIKEGIEVVELLFASGEGSIVRHDRDQAGQLVAIRDESDVDDHRTAVAGWLQQGALAYVADYGALRQRYPHLRIPRATAVMRLARLLQAPSRTQAEHLGEIMHCEGVGHRHTKQHIARPPAPRRLLMQPWRARQELRAAYWKAGCDARVAPWQRVLQRVVRW